MDKIVVRDTAFLVLLVLKIKGAANNVSTVGWADNRKPNNHIGLKDISSNESIVSRLTPAPQFSFKMPALINL